MLIGLGTGLAMPTLMSWTLSKLPDRAKGRGLGAMNSFFFAGQFLSPIFFSWFLTNHESQPFIIAAMISFALGSLFLFIGKRTIS
jgi:MFS family permease